MLDHLIKKTFIGLGDNIKTSLEFLELDNIINEKAIRNGIISAFFKMEKLGLKISNYKKHEIIKWFSSVFL